MSDQTPSAQAGTLATVPPNEQPVERSPRAGLIKFIERLSSGEVPKYEHSRTFVFPFLVGEERFTKLNEIVAAEFQRIVPSQEMDFTSETRFRDLSTLRFDDFAEFLAKAGERRNPEKVSLNWRKLFIDSSGMIVSGAVDLQFTTEQETPVEKLVVEKVILANVMLLVSGSDQMWTENVYAKLEPYIESTQLSDIYKPLWVFRNRFLVQIVSLVLSWAGLYAGMHLASIIFGTTARASQVDVLNSILKSDTANAKLDKLASYLLTPDNAPWYEPFRALLFGAAGYVLVFVCGMRYLPKLTPTSHIAIGLSKYRAENAHNIYRLVVGAGFVGLLVEPLLKYLLGLAVKLLAK